MDITNLKITVSAETGSALGQLQALQNSINTLKSLAGHGIGFQRISADLQRFTGILSQTDVSRFAGQMERIGNAALSISGMLSQANAALEMFGSHSEEISELNAHFSEMNGEAEQIQNNLGVAKKQLTGVGNEARKTERKVSLLSKTFASIGRIAFYRAVRGGLMSLVNGVGEGLKNLAQYSSNFQKTMSGFSTEALYLKNAFATMLEPILTILQPIVVKIGDFFADLFTKASMFFNFLAGNSTYNKALKYWTEYDNGVKETNKSVNKLKASILGFDELNVLSDNTDSASGGGTAGANAADMFETLNMPSDVSDWWKTAKSILSYVSETISDAWETIKKVGASIKNWSIPEKVLGAFALLASLLTFGAGGTIALAFAVAISYNIGKKIGLGTATTTDFAAAACAVLGATFIGFKTAGVIGASIGLAVSVVALTFGISQGLAEKAKADYESNPEIKKTIEWLSESEKITKNIELAFELREQGLNDLKTKYETAKDLVGKIYDLVDNNGDIPTIQAYVDALNSLGFGTLISSFDPLTGKIGEAKTAVDELLDSMMKVAVINYAKDKYADVLMDNYDIKNAQKLAQESVDIRKNEAYNAARAFLDKIGEDYNPSDVAGTLRKAAYLTDIKGVFAYPEATAFLTAMDGVEDALSQLDIANKDLTESEKELAKYTELATGKFAISDDGITLFSDIAKSAQEAGIAIGNTSEALKIDLYGDADDIKNKFETLNPGLNISVTDTGKIVSDDLIKINNYLSSLNLPTLEISVTDTPAEVAAQIYSINRLLTQANMPTITIDVAWNIEDLDLGWYSGLSLNGVSFDNKGNVWGYATGGFPEDGLFFANHGEMVGQFSNGKNVVANNEQIVAGIAQGVYDAMMRANNANNSGDTVIPIYIDNNLSTTKIISASDKANRKAGRPIVPIGV